MSSGNYLHRFYLAINLFLSIPFSMACRAHSTIHFIRPLFTSLDAYKNENGNYKLAVHWLKGGGRNLRKTSDSQLEFKC